ncbi:MAG: glycosyltransferase family 2 protein [Salibacteraceae bacterium]
MSTPRITIITVVYNSEKLLPITIQSIEAIKSDKIEWVVVDGASSDNSLAVLKQHEGLIDSLISEPDKGIYDAMNKGLKKSTGDYVIFINAGDEIRKEAVEKIFELNLDADIIYGDALYVNDSREPLGLRSKFTSRSLPSSLTLNSYTMGQRVSHQSFLVKRILAPGYNLEYKISADYDWMVTCIKRSASNYNLQIPLSNFLYGGISKQNQKQALTERFSIMKNHYGLMMTLYSHFKIVLRGIGFYGRNQRMD